MRPYAGGVRSEPTTDPQTGRSCVPGAGILNFSGVSPKQICELREVFVPLFPIFRVNEIFKKLSASGMIRKRMAFQRLANIRICVVGIRVDINLRLTQIGSVEGRSSLRTDAADTRRRRVQNRHFNGRIHPESGDDEVSSRWPRASGGSGKFRLARRF